MRKRDHTRAPPAGLIAAARAVMTTLALALAVPARSEPGHVFPPLTDADRAAIHAAIPTRARAHPTRPRRMLVLYATRGYVHASIPYANEALTQLGTVTGAYTATLSDDLQELSDSRLSAYDAVVFNNTTHLSLSAPQRAALLAFVHGGKGIVGIHAASDSFYTWPEGQELIGGLFHSHPWTAEDTVAVKLDDPASPVTAAFADQGFWVKDEIYQIIGPYSREHTHELLSLDMSRPENARKPDQLVRDDADFPVAWIQHIGKGRVFYTSLGHNPEIYRTPQILQHYLDGIQFVLGDLRADATPSSETKHPPVAAAAPEHPIVVLDETQAPN